MTYADDDSVMEPDHNLPRPQINDRIDRAYSGIIERLLDVDNNADTAMEKLGDWIDSQWGQGAFTETEKRQLLRSHLIAGANTRAGNRARRLIENLADGQLGRFEYLEIQWEPVTADKLRRTTLRNVTADDIRRMVAERAANLSKQISAFERFKAAAEALIDMIRGFATLGDWAVAALTDEDENAA